MFARPSAVLLWNAPAGVADDLAARFARAGSLVVNSESESFDVIAAFPGGPEERSGLGALRTRHNSAPILAFLSVDEDIHLPSLYLAGARAFVRPDTSEAEIALALAVIRQGGVHIAGMIAAALFAADDDMRRQLLAAGLTPREREILRLIAVNMSNKDIARHLKLSVRTVETHRLNIRKKTGAGNWRQLSGIAERIGLIRPLGEYAALAELPAGGFHEE